MNAPLQYCNRCLYPSNHPLGLTFDDAGVCSGCRVHEEKDEINWKEKAAILEEIFSKYRGHGATGFDCVIPVTGNGDSYFVVDTIKNKYGLNPLLVTYNIQFNTKIGIRNLANLISKLDCDHLSYTVDPAIAKKVSRIAMHRIGDMYWHVLAGSQVFPVQVATQLGIPLVIWGVNGWQDQTGMFSHHDFSEMSHKVWKEHSLRGTPAQNLMDSEQGIGPRELAPFMYPSDEAIEKADVRGLYLSNFLRWDAQAQTEEMIKKYGYETCDQQRTHNRYEQVGCWHNAGLHDFVKFLKHGYGKVSDHASRDIRLGRLTREQGLELVRKFQTQEPKDLGLFLKWSGMTRDEFFKAVDRFRDPRAWKLEGDQWILRESILNPANAGGSVEEVRLPLNDAHGYLLTKNLEDPALEDDYVLFGRSYCDEENFKAVEG